MKNWESEFASHILKRSFDYFEEGAVHELIQTADGYEATVEGSDSYSVEIAISNQTLMAMSFFCSRITRLTSRYVFNDQIVDKGLSISVSFDFLSSTLSRVYSTTSCPCFRSSSTSL